MADFTSNTYTLRRKILTFTNEISRSLSKPERKFTADITYGMLAAKRCLLTDVVDQLHEDSKKINIVDRLSRHLEKGTPAVTAASYLQQIKKWVSSEPVIHIDDSDVVKPDGYKFESLGIVRDWSESTSTKNVYKKGHDDNKMFLKLDDLGQEYVIRLTSKRKLLYHNKWTPATELRNRRKGKVKTKVFYKGETMRLIFPMSKSKSRHPERTFIWCWFTALPSIQ